MNARDRMNTSRLAAAKRSSVLDRQLTIEIKENLETSALLPNL